MKIDIITINLNNKDGLKKTMNSVINQTKFDDINYIIIDGGSTDGSKELIKKNKSKLFYYESKKDKGIYDAMNKGIKHITGDYVLFLNSGDYLIDDDVIERIIPNLDGTDIIYGNLAIANRYVTVVSSSDYKHREDRKILVDYKKGEWPIFVPSEILNKEWFYENNIPHQSSFIKKEAVKPYSTKYKIIGDNIFFYNAFFKYGNTHKHIDVTVCAFDITGISSTKRDFANEELNDFYKNKKGEK